MSCNTSALAGYGGSVTGGVTATEIRNWTMDLTQDIYDVTSYSSNGWKEFVAGLKGATGSYESVGDTVETVGSKAACVFNTGGTGDPSITADILVTNVNYNVPVDGEVGYSVDFTVCGAIT